MNTFEFIQMLSALSGIAMIAVGSLWLKQYLKRGFCCL